MRRSNVRDDARVEIMLGHINTDESGHVKHSFWLNLIRQGASELILECDDSLKALRALGGSGG